MKPIKSSLLVFFALIFGLSCSNAFAGFGPKPSGGGAAITGAASTIATADLTASKVLVSNSSGKVAASSISSAFLDPTSSIQTQLNAKAASSHTHAASDITSGTVATARLGSGTANSTTYLRGDSTWATVSGGTAPSYCRYYGVAARGSTNTLVWRFTTAADACAGADLSYSSSAANGDAFPVATTGVYMVVASGYYVSGMQANIMVGSSINNTVSTAATEFRAPMYLAQFQTWPWVGKITAGEKIYITSAAAPNNVEPPLNFISIARIN